LRALASSHTNYGGFSAPYSKGVELLLYGSNKLTIIGSSDTTWDFVKKSYTNYLPFRIVEILDPVEDETRIKVMEYDVI